jgi:hypothetical protein
MIERPKWFLMPPRPGVCQVCAVDHQPDDPHNRDSLFYQMKFQMENGYSPTWLDAMAHCSLDTQIAWERELRRRGAWDG